jgi:methylenetetrahydrofolate--tRNA-(uracil-5-)-methyltransferase
MADSLSITILGGGLAGCEAAWQAAEAGWRVRLVEMRPTVSTPAHRTDRLAELVCSNSMKSESPEDASGVLKAEMRALGSLVLRCAEAHRVPAGSALAVDRGGFAAAVTAALALHPAISVVREEAVAVPPDRPLIVATGPLTSDRLAGALRDRFHELLHGGRPGGQCGMAGNPLPSVPRVAECGTAAPDAVPPGAGHAASGASPLAVQLAARGSLLHFYDAISPIVAADSIDLTPVYAAARYGKGGADYLNCPLDRQQYAAFREALLAGEQYPLHDFETPRYFEGCLPIEELAARGEETLRYGPMRPVGLRDPRTGRRPYAVVQLRPENMAGGGRPTMYNLVGFQTRLRRGPQARAIRMIPGLEQAEVLRYGTIHRNTFMAAPALLHPTLQFRGDPGLFFAGQLTGVEGYLESAATGLLAGINAARLLQGTAPVVPPRASMLGALLCYLTTTGLRTFQPINANFGLLPPAPGAPRNREERNRRLAERARAEFDRWHETAMPAPAAPA